MICSESCLTFFPFIPLHKTIAKRSLLDKASAPFWRNLSRGLSIIGISFNFVTKLKDIPIIDRPRERFLQKGADALSKSDLLAIVLCSGIKGKNVKQLS